MSNQGNLNVPGPTGKIALVTGGSRGLGRNIALELRASGHDVILTYRNQKAEGVEVVAEIEKLGRQAVLLQLDVASAGSFDAFRDAVADGLQANWRRSSFDFLIINNAGIDRMSPSPPLRRHAHQGDARSGRWAARRGTPDLAAHRPCRSGEFGLQQLGQCL